MGRLLLKQTSRLALGLLGAALLAAALATLAVPQAHTGLVPYAVAFGGELVKMGQLDFGLSDATGWSAFGTLTAALPYTAILLLLAAIVAVLVGVPLGLVFGSGPVRRATAPLMQIVAAAPVFCVSLALIWIAIRNGGFYPAPFTGFGGDAVRTLLLPVFIVGMAGAGAVQLALHRAASQAQGQPWRVTLRMMGLSAGEIERVYVAPQVFAGLFTDLGDVVLALLSAAAVVEWTFGWQGAAELFVKSIALGDWNVVALILFVFAAIKFAAEFAGALAAAALTRVGGEA